MKKEAFVCIIPVALVPVALIPAALVPAVLVLAALVLMGIIPADLGIVPGIVLRPRRRP